MSEAVKGDSEQTVDECLWDMAGMLFDGYMLAIVPVENRMFVATSPTFLITMRPVPSRFLALKEGEHLLKREIFQTLKSCQDLLCPAGERERLRALVGIPS